MTVTDGDGVGAMHAGGERAAFGCVGGVKASEPAGSACGSLGEKFAECLASYGLVSGFIAAGGDPLLVSPVVRFARELVQVPLPFKDFFGLGEYADQTKRIDAGEWKL